MKEKRRPGAAILLPGEEIEWGEGELTATSKAAQSNSGKRLEKNRKGGGSAAAGPGAWLGIKM